MDAAYSNDRALNVQMVLVWKRLQPMSLILSIAGLSNYGGLNRQ